MAGMKQVPTEDWDKCGVTSVIWSFLLGACVLIHIFVRTEKYAIIMVKIFGATKQNWVGRSTWRPAFVHPCFTFTTLFSLTHLFQEIIKQKPARANIIS
jgi:hypothetical protein